MKHGVYVPPSGPLADPKALLEIAAAADAAGWDGFFLWDHILRPEAESPEVLDAWSVLAAVGAGTQRIRIGPMVTPCIRRRPQKLAREIATVDLLTSGRLTVGFGLGVDEGGELSKFDEVVDEERRGRMLTEAVDLIDRLLSGDAVHAEGEFFAARDVTFLPRPAQEPRPPFWFAARGLATNPLRRAARYDGVFPISIDAPRLERLAEFIGKERGGLDGFDIAVVALPGLDLDEFEVAGATWAMWAFLPGTPPSDVLHFVEKGPAAFAR